MNAVQLPYLVEAVLILTAGIFGFLLRRRGRPFGKGKLVTHLFFYVWLTVGYGFISYPMLAEPGPTVIWVPTLVMGVAVVAQVATGIVLLASRTARGALLLRTHLASAVVMVLSSLTAFVAAGVVS